ncbi:MAG: RluA family pseudouridine synthase [Verrucomicrobiae bacterium]|nr:RluA family pseudouridine synthase [Verrucomicrobiae bacterium]
MFTVTSDQCGQRLDRFLQTQLPQMSRAFLQKLIEEGNVTVNGQRKKPSYRVAAGDRVAVSIPPARPLEVAAEPIPLDVLYEDDDLIVVNKPAGMVVHPAAGSREHTLVNALLHHCQGRLSGIGGVERPGIVHRLDKGTSGCIVVAKTDLAHQGLVAQFKARRVRKIYRAICWGVFAQAAGRIETVIGRSSSDRKKMSARVLRGRAAVSEYRVLNQFAEFALVEVVPHTGRTHQIRVHMAYIGHPVVGDTTYGRRARTAEAALPFAVERPLLHAYKLGFVHPRSGAWLELEAPLPEDMVRLCKS